MSEQISTSRPSYLSRWLNRLLMVFVFLNMAILSSLPATRNMWLGVAGESGDCAYSACGWVRVFGSPFVFYIAAALTLLLVAKEWLLSPFSLRVKINLTVLFVTTIFLVVFFLVFYWPVFSAPEL